MANIKSQKKRNRQNEARRMRNKGTRSELRTRLKQAEASIESGSPTAPADVSAAQKQLGKAAKSGVLHRNAAARRQSRLMRKAAASS